MQRENLVILPAEQGRVNQQLLDLEAPCGPVELTLLERIEAGLIYPAPMVQQQKAGPSTNSPRNRFQGPKEIIFVSGWVNINSVYDRYFWGFLAKMLIGCLIIFSLEFYNQRLWPVALGLLIVNLIHFCKSLYFLISQRERPSSLKLGLWLDLNLSLSYIIYFSGLVLLLTSAMRPRFLPLFSLPYLVFSAIVFFADNEESAELNYRKYLIFEAAQLLLISLKLSQPNFLFWNYTMTLFLAAAIYLTVLGLMLSIIVSCALFGTLYRNLSGGMLRAQLWMTWYYLSSGLAYIYLLKGTVQYYERRLFADSEVGLINYATYSSPDYRVLLASGFLLAFFSAVSLVLHLAWKKEIKDYLAAVIYRNEQKKEVSLRLFRKSFAFKLVQISATYFTKEDKMEASKQDTKAENSNKQTFGDQSNAAQKNERGQVCEASAEQELCLFCCSAQPNIMAEPCGHGGFCKECLVEYLKHDGGKCPFCKAEIDRLFLVEQDIESKNYFAKGEINLRN